ncbi:hypothetical protein G3M48_004184 [Beauveria asiatica]|uniref:Uncharacterized protein n=1 Tax=Beauveria asiatica TaxID=1069075 RepID=A0AAW0RUI6_9HYPO
MSRRNLPDIHDILAEEPDIETFKVYRRLPQTSNTKRIINDLWISRAMRDLVLFIIGGKGRDPYGFPLYLELTFSPAVLKDQKQMIKFWMDFHSADQVFYTMIAEHALIPNVQSVYLPAETGTLLGPILGIVSNRVDKQKALLIQIANGGGSQSTKLLQHIYQMASILFTAERLLMLLSCPSVRGELQKGVCTYI